MTPSVEKAISVSPSWLSQDVSSDSPDDNIASKHERSRTPRTLAPNLTRRSHKKSRSGCFSCKARKIKCQETRPACDNCVLKDLSCKYPNGKHISSRDNGPLNIARRPQPSSLSLTNDMFTMTDMRLFHHFLTMAYPHLPLGNEKVWVNEIPKFAQKHDYLMHAMLALGASHLDRIAPVAEHTTKAIVHRGHAMAGLSRALAKSEREYGEGDAMVATCYALTFQSTYMSDGLFDFITMVRGCALITGKIREEQAQTAFNLQPEWHFKLMEPRMKDLPIVHQPLLDSGIAALEETRQFLVTRTDHHFHGALMKVLHGLSRTSREGYTSFILVYALWYELCNDSFRGECFYYALSIADMYSEFMDPNNMVAQLLLSYFIAIQFLMVPLSQHEWPSRFDGRRTEVLGGVIEQGERIFATLPPDMQPFTWWQIEIMDTAKAEIADLDPCGPKVLRLREFALA